MIGTKLIYKNIENKNYSKSTLVDDLLFSLTNMKGCYNVTLPTLNTNVSYNEHVTNLLQWDDNSTTIPCLNVNCEWISFITTFYPALSEKFPLPSDPNHIQGYCRICQYILEENGRRSNLKLLSGQSVAILNSNGTI